MSDVFYLAVKTIYTMIRKLCAEKKFSTKHLFPIFGKFVFLIFKCLLELITYTYYPFSYRECSFN